MKQGLLVTICVAALLPVGEAAARTAGAGSGGERPTAPTNLHITSEPTTAEVSVAWNPSTFPSGSVDYYVEMDNFLLSWWVGRNTTSARFVFGYDPGSTHTFSVWASDSSDPTNASPLSNTITVNAAPE